MPGASSGLFKINPDTGEVATTTTLDREVQEVFTLRGKGSLDDAKQTKTSSRRVVVTFYISAECLEIKCA